MENEPDKSGYINTRPKWGIRQYPSLRLWNRSKLISTPFPFVRKDNVAKDKYARPWPSLRAGFLRKTLRIYFSNLASPLPNENGVVRATAPRANRRQRMRRSFPRTVRQTPKPHRTGAKKLPRFCMQIVCKEKKRGCDFHRNLLILRSGKRDSNSRDPQLGKLMLYRLSYFRGSRKTNRSLRSKSNHFIGNAKIKA